jgi:hypothetical protein
MGLRDSMEPYMGWRSEMIQGIRRKSRKLVLLISDKMYPRRYVLRVKGSVQWASEKGHQHLRWRGIQITRLPHGVEHQ